MKARWLTLVAAAPLIIGTVLIESCGGVGGPTSSSQSPGSNAPTQQFLALMSSTQRSATYIGSQACAAAACHGGATTSAAHAAIKLTTASMRTGDTGQYTTWQQTVHAQKNVGCESCHGPGSAHAKQPTNSDGTINAILAFPQITSIEVCGQCHGVEHDDLITSNHTLLAGESGNPPNPATSPPIAETITNPTTTGQQQRCFVCHGGLIRAEFTENGIDPSQMTTTQIVNSCNDIVNTVPYSATCSTCHNPHAKTGNLTGAGNEAQLYHPELLTNSTDIAPGTTPAQYTTPNQICGQCHNGRGTTATDAYLQANTSRPSAHHSDQFNSLLGVGGAESPDGPPQRTSSHANIAGQCATCHMGSGSSHTMVVDYSKGCQPCHSASDAASKVTALQTEVVDDLTQLSTSMSTWAQSTFGDPEDWDYTSNVTDGSKAPSQSLIPIEVKRARHNYYYIVISGDYGVHNYAYTLYLIQWAQTNLQNAGISIVPKAQVDQMPMATKLAIIKQARQKCISADSAG